MCEVEIACELVLDFSRNHSTLMCNDLDSDGRAKAMISTDSYLASSINMITYCCSTLLERRPQSMWPLSTPSVSTCRSFTESLTRARWSGRMACCPFCSESLPRKVMLLHF